jgi:uncharacterized protein
MKWLLILLVVLGGLWWLRQQRLGSTSRPSRPRPKQDEASSSPQAMTRCLHCGLHLPREDATVGTLGDYCSTAHRQQHED